MSDSFFYSPISENDENIGFLTEIERFANDSLIQVYVINKPLGERKYKYDYKHGVVLLIPKYKMIFVNFAPEKNEEFEDYIEDFIEDLGYISDKYGYKGVLGRPRAWRNEFFEKKNYEDISNLKIELLLEQNKLKTKESERNGEYLISLLTGSINDVDRIGGTFPESLLDKIKKKIVLFDGDQTRFIYQEPFQKRITIQGLAGTGKTELLLHKLKDLYIKDQDTKIVFTCHNKILAESLRLRIPEFFNFMKVDEQIEWNERLWTINSWGSQSYKNSGLYSLICNHYRIPFQRYSYHTTFGNVCNNAFIELERLDNFEPFLDYVLIDESQDFSEEFFKLCEKVTKKSIYIAGDIFQNVFDTEIISKVTPDFLLNKCYRTDSRTLMFAHGIGMGLFEDNYLRWLNDEEWEACGYVINKMNSNYNLSRKPLRRFEDLEASGTESIKLVPSENQEYANKIIKILEEIVDNNPTSKPDDIGIIFLENMDKNYKLANKLQILIQERFGWNVNIGYETKTKQKGTLFISNRNNVKGLEFPFIICITQAILSTDLQKRNSIYMMLTRSFLTTYFIISSDNGEEFINKLKKGIEYINSNGSLLLVEPSKSKKEALRNAIINNPKIKISHFDLVEGIMDKNNVKKEYKENLHKIVEVLCKDEFDLDTISEVIRVNYILMKPKDI